MGGAQTKTIIEKHYYLDPKILKQLEDSMKQISKLTSLVKNLELKLQQAYQESKKQKNPKLYKNLKAVAFQTFLDNIELASFEEKIPKKDGERHHILIGNISAGKTSMINFACKTKLLVGVGQTTRNIQKVTSNGNVHIWDSPGTNEDFTYYDTEVLAYFHTADRIFIVYPDSLKSCKNMIRVLFTIKPSNIFLVRTQCDRCDQTQSKTIQQELATDKKQLDSWGIKLQILATSAKKNNKFLDNERFRRLLTGEI